MAPTYDDSLGWPTVVGVVEGIVAFDGLVGHAMVQRWKRRCFHQMPIHSGPLDGTLGGTSCGLRLLSGPWDSRRYVWCPFLWTHQRQYKERMWVSTRTPASRPYLVFL